MPKTGAVCSRILAGAIVVALGAACSSSSPVRPGDDDEESPGTADGRPLVATTFTILADMTERIAGDRIRVESLTEPGADVHHFEPTAGDLRRVADADLVVSNGLGLDAWLLRFLDGTDAPHVEASTGVETVAIRSGNHTGRANPHAWMSPTEGQRYVHTIADALADLDPGGAHEFAARAREYAREIDELGERHRVLVTCEGAFSYLARDLGLDELYLWPVNSESQGLPRQVAALIEDVRGREVPAVFCESTVSGAAMEQVATQTGSPLAGPLYVDSLSTPDGPVPTYLDLLDHDLTVISEALTS